MIGSEGSRWVGDDDAMNWVDQPCTSADERDVVCSPRCRDCVWAVQGLVVFKFH